VGSYYGGCLARAGHDVYFLLRSDYEVVRRQGVQILSPKGDFTFTPRCARHAQEIGPAELVVIALKTTANCEFPHLLPPLVDGHTAVLTLQNGLGNEEQLARWFPPRQILGGMCFVCLNRIAPGVVRHLDHGLVVLGEMAGPAGERTRTLAEAFAKGGVPCRVSDNLARAHWEKLVWNIPFNGLGVAGTAGYEAVVEGRLAPGPLLGPCLDTQMLLGDVRWTRLVHELMREVIHAAHAQGHALEGSLADQQIERTRTMGAYRASTLLDFEKGLPLELDSIFREPLRRAQQAGAETPRLAALCRVLEAIQLVL
jgi:2-dehydropantoate 2-reductase